MIPVLSKPNDEITIADIQDLINSQVPEGEQTEFKRDIILAFLNELSPFLSAIATVGLIVVTGGMWWTTSRMPRASNDLVKESKIRRETNTMPYLAAKLRAYPDHGEFIDVVLSNIFSQEWR